jgi:branched-chain amino acid transport system ATP-binding protein
MEIAQLAWSAVILACSYILLGVGMNLQYATLRVVNFAQGQIFMIGAMIVAVGSARLGVGGAAVLALVCCGLISVLIEKLAISPVLRSSTQQSRIQASLLATAASGIALTAIAAIVWGSGELPVPSLVTQRVFHIGIVVTVEQIEVLAGAAVCLALVWVILYRTRVGMDIRALRSDPYAAQLYGVRRGAVASLVFFVSGAIGGLAGVLVSPATSISPNIGIDYSIITILCVIISGLGRVWRVLPVAIAFAVFWTAMQTYVSSANGYYYALFALLALVVIVPVFRQISPAKLARSWWRTMSAPPANLIKAGARRRAASQLAAARTAASEAPPAVRRGFGSYDLVRIGSLAVLLLIAVGIGVIPTNLYIDSLIGLGGAYLIAIVGQNIALGMVGQMVFSQTFFMAAGAYVTFVVEQFAHWSFWACLLTGLASCFILALIVGFFIVRLQGFYLAAATLMLPFLIPGIASLTSRWSGGLSGFGGFTTPIAQGVPYTIFVLVIAAVVCWGVHNLMSFGPGWGWRAVRDNEKAARSMGIDAASAKLRAFLIASVLGGLSGALMAPLLGFIAPDTFNLNQMIFFLFASVVGGMSSVIGAAIGAAILMILNQTTTSSGQYSPLIFGVALVVALIVFPDGVAGTVPRLLASFFNIDLPGMLMRWKLTAHLGAGWQSPAGAGEISGDRSGVPPAALPVPGPVQPVEAAGLAVDKAEVLQARGVRVVFGGLEALGGVDIDIRRAQVTGVVGPNGAGKSTLLDVLAGFRVPTAGDVLLGDETITAVPAHRRARQGIATVFQARHVLGGSRVVENVAIAAGSRTAGWYGRALLRTPGAVRAERRAYARAVAELSRLGVRADSYLAQIADLPFGAQRVVEIASGTAARPDFILLDEPAGGLDTAELVNLREVIGALRAQGVGVLIIEHNIGFIRSVCDWLVVLDHGTKMAEGVPAEVLAREDVLEAYFGITHTQLA